MVGSNASRVITIGGFGLFLDPGGRPRGRLTTSMLPPSLGLAPSGLDFSPEDAAAFAAAADGDSSWSESREEIGPGKWWEKGGNFENMLFFESRKSLFIPFKCSEYLRSKGVMVFE